MSSRPRRRLGCWLPVVGLPLCILLAHYGIRACSNMAPPPLALHEQSLRKVADGVQQYGASFVVRRSALTEVHLRGTPEEIGVAHARLLRGSMERNEAVLYEELERQIPLAAARALVFDWALLRYRSLDRGLDSERRRELAAKALGFSPDPFQGILPTYQRFVFLDALYDIALSFERSPLIGCTTFVLPQGGGPGRLLARAFDFEVDEIFDGDKAVFFVQSPGEIPLVSVAWPGLVGVVSGMNLEGLAVVVHGARAGEPRAEGEPVVDALRRVLATSRTVQEGLEALRRRAPMVSHIVVLADARGQASVAERVPGRPLFVRPLGRRAAVANHFLGPAAGDPRNLAVRAQTTTVQRQARADELVGSVGDAVSVPGAIALLRDRRGVGGASLPRGDRRAIDALIATHGVVMDTERRVLWVSEAPHLLGRFVAFDLRAHFASQAEAPVEEGRLAVAEADEWLVSGQYERWRKDHEPGRE